jgi:hypothetical protein
VEAKTFLGIYRILEVTPKGAMNTAPTSQLTDWARPNNMYGKGGEVAPQRTLHTTRFLLHVSRNGSRLTSRVPGHRRRHRNTIPSRVVRLIREPAPAPDCWPARFAVIYGAAGAIGGAVSRAFAREGAQLFLAGTDPRRVAALAKELDQTGAITAPALVDAMDREAVERHLADVVRSAGHVDISFNLVGLGGEQGQLLTAMSREGHSTCQSRMPCAHCFITANAAAASHGKSAAPA